MVTGVTGRSVLPPEQYVASLARKRMAATAFFRDGPGRVLLVNPVYKETWDLPGGAEESPHAACRREVAEELRLDRPPGPVLAVDWVPSRPERPERLIVVYDGGVLSDAEVRGIVLADGELAGFAFVPGDEVAGLVTPLLARSRRWRTAARLSDRHLAGLGGHGPCAVHSSHAPCDWYRASACWPAIVPFTQVARCRRGSGVGARLRADPVDRPSGGERDDQVIEAGAVRRRKVGEGTRCA